MPHESPWPPVLALTLAAVFMMLVIGSYGVAGVMGIVCLLALARLALAGAGGAHDATDASPRGAAVGAAGRPAGWWGMVILIASEATLFAALIGTYFYLRFRRRPGRPRDSRAEPRSCPLVLARRAWCHERADAARVARGPRRAARRGTRFYSSSPSLVQAGYLAYEVHDYSRPAARASHITRERLQLDLLHAARRRPRPRRSSASSSTSGCSRSSRAGSRPTG